MVNRCCVVHGGLVMDHWGFMMDGSLVMNWSLMVYCGFVMNGRSMVHWRLFVHGFVASFMMSNLVMLSVSDSWVLSVVLSGRLFSSLVVRLDGLVLDNRDRHLMVITVLLGDAMIRHNWDSLMHDCGRVVSLWLGGVLLVRHEFLKERLRHLDIFDMAGLVVHRLLWNVMGRGISGNVADLWLSVAVFGHLDEAGSGLNVVGLLDEARLLDESRLLDVARSGSKEWLLLDIVGLRCVHRLTVVCLVRCNVLVWHVDVAVLRGVRLLG